MLHILLMILKTIGIILLVLLGLLLVILGMVLFVPVRYRVKGHKDETDMAGMVRFSWLFGLILVLFGYQEKSMKIQFKILGLDIWRLLKNKENKTNNKKTASKKEYRDKLKQNANTKDSSNADEETVIDLAGDFGSYKKEKTRTLGRIWDRVKKIVSKIMNIPSRVMESIRKIKLTIKNIYDKINYWKEYLSDEKIKSGLLLVKTHLFKVLKHILPGKVRGALVFGFEDPCKTGQILAGMSMIYPLYYKQIIITPDFSRAIFEGNLDIKGRIYIGYIVKSILILLINKNIQYIIHTFRNKEES